METIALAIVNTIQLALIAYMASRFSSMRRYMLVLLRDLRYDLSGLDPKEPISHFPYRSEFLITMDLLIKLLERRSETRQPPTQE
jgi:hypothetical protein